MANAEVSPATAGMTELLDSRFGGKPHRNLQETTMRNLTFIGASALILALGVGAASAEPFNPVTGYDGSSLAPSYGYNGAPNEGRAAAEDGYYNGWTAGSPILEQFHEGHGHR
jgi:hypothetical protein